MKGMEQEERYNIAGAMDEKLIRSKILIFGGTGYIGKYMVEASVFSGHKTFIYTRPIDKQNAEDAYKIKLIQEFQSMGVTIIQGNLEEHEKLVAALRMVDIVIATLAVPQVLDQLHIIDAIKVAGNIKRFVPSDFGVEEDKVTPLPPFEALLEKKRKIRRMTETAGIPYTFVSSNCFASYFVNHLLAPYNKQPHSVSIYGNGTTMAVFNYEKDIAMYTIKVANDPKTCNKVVNYRPPKNVVSQIQLISRWEKTGVQILNKVYVPEEKMVKLSQTLQAPQNIEISILHSLFVTGATMCELMDDDLEASVLYPDYQYTTIDQLLDIFLTSPPTPALAKFE